MHCPAKMKFFRVLAHYVLLQTQKDFCATQWCKGNFLSDQTLKVICSCLYRINWIWWCHETNMGHVRRRVPIPNVETQQLHSLFIERISHLTIFYEPPTQSPWYAFSMYVHLLLLDNLISTLFEHFNIMWFILSIYYLLLFVHLLMPTV